MRDKLRKRVALSAVTALTLFVAVPVYADTYDALNDDAALLSDEEQQSLSEEITNLQETTGWEVYVLTTFEFHGIVGHKVNGAEVTDPKYGVTSEGYFEVNLSNVKQEEGTEPFVVINAGKAGYTGSVTITKITFVK